MSGFVRLLDTVVGHSATVVEASAGTGKTYQLERLVFDLVAAGRARLDEILVVTFTERAANELVTRIRKTIEDGVSNGGSGSRSDDGGGDERARPAAASAPEIRARLRAARTSFDQASITTIHAFCQRLLTDEPLLTGRLLGQTQIDAQAAFGEVFRDTLRTTLCRDPEYRTCVDAYLRRHRDVEGLQALLYRAAAARGRWAFRYDEAELTAIATELTAIDLAPLERYWKPILQNGNKVSTFKKRTAALWPALAAALADRDWLALLGVLDLHANDTFHEYVDTIAAARATAPVIERLGQGLLRLVRTPTVTEAVVQKLLPVVASEVERKKVGQGLYDFDDMISAVARALDGPNGQALGERLRRRFRFALIDEAQDTEALQWRIFERVFLRSDGANPLVLIGDPKQAIYGFRGADVHTYVAARAAIRARGGAAIALDRNFRSAAETVRAVNAILDQTAVPSYFTSQGIAYDHPVTSDRGPLGAAAGVTLFKLDLPERPPKPLPVGPIKRAIRRAIAERILRLRREQPALPLSSMFVLSRTNAEAREMGVELGDAGVPHSFYKQEGLWKLPEAGHVRALLSAIADPTDRVARMHAWLTPFFGTTLRALEDLGDPPPHHPLLLRLHSWKVLADRRQYAALWASVFEESAVAPRDVLSRASRRRLGLYRQIADELLAETAARPLSPDELAATLGRYAAGQFPPARGGATVDRDLQRADFDDDAVQIMTMHRAKGLEAAHVFLYGALTGIPILPGDVHPFRDGDERVFCAGKPRFVHAIDLIRANRAEEDQRLLYVAMTRARDRLYMPFFPTTGTDEPELFGRELEHGDYTAFDKITGPYRHVNERLRQLSSDRARFAELFQIEAVPFPAPERSAEADLAARLSDWLPPSGSGAEVRAAEAERTARLRVSRRGFVITSYSRLKDADGGYQPPMLDEDEATSIDKDGAEGGADAVGGGIETGVSGSGRSDANDTTTSLAAPALEPQRTITSTTATATATNGVTSAAGLTAAPDLPGGTATGLFLHAVLEKVALGPLPPLGEWERQADVRRLLETECRRWDRDAQHLAAAARMVHGALTAPIVLPGARPLDGIAVAPRVRREVDFLFPMASAAAWGPRVSGVEPIPPSEDRAVDAHGFIRGVLDVLFEHEGRACFADWKSDLLPSFSVASMQAHVAVNYDLQIRIYTVALLRLLGITDRGDYDRRFGGLAYVFLRGVATLEQRLATTSSDGRGHGVYVQRPDYDEARAWESALGRPSATPTGGR